MPAFFFILFLLPSFAYNTEVSTEDLLEIPTLAISEHLDEKAIQAPQHVAFFHIDKTAGSKMGGLAKASFGENYFLNPSGEELFKHHLDPYYFLHFHHPPYDNMHEVAKVIPHGSITFTILRDPLTRLASHIRFYKYCAQQEMPWLGDILIKAFQKTDLNDPVALQALLKKFERQVPPNFRKKFNNSMMRSFLPDPSKAVITQEDFETATYFFEQNIDYVCFQENLTDSLQEFCLLYNLNINLTTSENRVLETPEKIEHINLKDEAIHHVLEEHIKWDVKFYEAAKKRHQEKVSIPFTVESGAPSFFLFTLPKSLDVVSLIHSYPGFEELEDLTPKSKLMALQKILRQEGGEKLYTYFLSKSGLGEATRLEAHTWLADYYVHKKEYMRAIEHISRAIDIAPSPWRAKILLKALFPEFAESDLKTLLPMLTDKKREKVFLETMLLNVEENTKRYIKKRLEYL